MPLMCDSALYPEHNKHKPLVMQKEGAMQPIYIDVYKRCAKSRIIT
jgi:hypothetical protein